MTETPIGTTKITLKSYDWNRWPDTSEMAELRRQFDEQTAAIAKQIVMDDEAVVTRMMQSWQRDWGRPWIVCNQYGILGLGYQDGRILVSVPKDMT
jgi:hypothetical protein